MTYNHDPLAGSYEWYVKQQVKDRRDRIAEAVASTLPPPSEYIGLEQTENSYKVWARRAVRMADALIAELDKP